MAGDVSTVYLLRGNHFFVLIIPRVIVVDIVKDRYKILIYEHYSGEVVFEYNKDKKADKNAYTELKGIWDEVKGCRVRRF